MNKSRQVKRNVTDALELPKEVLLNLPFLSIIGREEITIENYKGIIEYCENTVRINTSCGVIKIMGKNLSLKQLAVECVVISGTMDKMEWIA